MNLIIVIMVLLFFCGCSLEKKVSPLNKRQVKDTGTGAVESGNSYYDFMVAQLNRKKGDLERAILYLNKAIQKDPESSYLKLELAMVYLQQKDNKKAIDIIEKIVKKEPENIRALILYGKLKQTLKAARR